jgi:hypothetical protein
LAGLRHARRPSPFPRRSRSTGGKRGTAMNVQLLGFGEIEVDRTRAAPASLSMRPGPPASRSPQPTAIGSTMPAVGGGRSRGWPRLIIGTGADGRLPIMKSMNGRSRASRWSRCHESACRLIAQLERTR